jgi:hypothetical protein
VARVYPDAIFTEQGRFCQDTEKNAEFDPECQQDKESRDLLEIPVHEIAPIHGTPLPSIHHHAVMRRIHDLHLQRLAGNPHRKRTRVS